MKKTTLAALLSAAAITVAGAAWAVEAQPAQPAPAPAPAAEAAAEQPAPMVGMSDAVAVAEKEYKAKTYRANLRNSGQYGLVWDVHMVKEDETHVRALRRCEDRQARRRRRQGPFRNAALAAAWVPARVRSAP